MKKKFLYINYSALALMAVMVIYLFQNLFKLPEPLVWGVEIIILGVLYINYKRLHTSTFIDRIGFNLTMFYIAWLFFGFARATYYADGYWMWKSIFRQLLITFFYIVILVSTNIKVVQTYYRFYWKLFIPLVIVSFLIDGTPLHLNYVPYATLMLFLALVPNKQKIMLIGIMLMYFFTNFQRNDLIKIIITSLIGLYMAYLYFPMHLGIIKKIRFAFLVLPFILILLASSGTFNIFKMDEYIKGDFQQNVQTDEGVTADNLKADTRTFLFENVFYTVNKHDAWLLGRSPAFGDEGVKNFWGKDEATGLKGRYGNEVGVLDILLWYGLVGVFIYFLIYFRASYVAIYKSRNRYAKGIGLYVAFLWMWAFIWEKPLFETFFMMDLILLGLCFSKEFRHMNDKDVQLWIKNVFTMRRVKKIRYKQI